MYGGLVGTNALGGRAEDFILCLFCAGGVFRENMSSVGYTDPEVLVGLDDLRRCLLLYPSPCTP